MALGIRGRLTLWYTAVLLAVLVLFGAWVYLVESHLRVESLDRELRRTGTALAAAVDAELDEGASLSEAAPEAYKDFVAPGRLMALSDGGGAALPGAGAAPVLPPREPAGARPERVADVVQGGQRWRVVVQRHRHGDVGYEVAASAPLAQAQAEDAILRRTLLVGIPLALALAAAGGWWIARRALRPVSMMADQAREITDRTSGFRLRVPHPRDELGLLARAFNELLARLDGALTAQRQFMADASHELRTPVSIVQTTAEVTLSRPARSEQEYRDSLGIVAGQTGRLARMVQDMMTLARADAGGLPLVTADFYLDELVGDCAEQAALLAREREVEVRASAPGETAFRGDERLLRQMLMNLLDNAIRHTPPGGRVDARLAAVDGRVEIAVADTGAGVPAADRDRIFERFVRLDAARQRPGGAGLGLPIARCIAEAHGGTLTLADSGPSGSTFVVRLPSSSPHAP